MPTVQAGRPVSIEIRTFEGNDPALENNMPGKSRLRRNHQVRPSDKPPYRVPSMEEIRAVPQNGYRVASSFSGCGGSCLGFEMAGFRILWASEFIEEARTTYQANHPGVHLDERDIRLVQPGEILEATGLQVGELDVWEGSPPCASFSTAGKREKGWAKVKAYSDTEQRSDDLFFEYVRLVDGLRPKVFVAENVSGLAKGTAIGYFKEIHRRLAACGYRVEAKLLDAQWLGVPQARQRIIFIGVRDDLGIAPRYPVRLPYRYSIRDALPHLTRVVHDTSGLYGAGEVTDRPSPTITVGVNSINSCHFKVEEEPVLVMGAHGYFEGREVGVDEPCPTIAASGLGSYAYHINAPSYSDASIDGTAIGTEWDKLRPGEQSERYFNLVRPSPDQPCPTVTQTAGVRGAAGVTHPTEKRKFYIWELRRICAFPDDFILTGDFRQQWERLGRAVPPLMMRAVAEQVRCILDEAAARA